MSNSKLFVGNIPFTATSDSLESHFGQAGEVIEVALMHDRITGKSRGFAFVTMANAAGASKAIDSLNGVDLDGRSLTVSEARPREPRPQGGGDFRH